MVTSMSKGTVVIGLDGADWKVIDWMIEQDKLPIKKLKEEGCFGKLQSTISVSSAPAWTSFVAEKNPRGHGIYDFLKFTGQGKEVVASKDRNSKAVWDYTDRKVISINVPLTYPPEKLKGRMISGLPPPGEDSDYCCPPSLYEDLKAKFNPFKMRSEVYYSENDWEEFIKDQIRCWENTEKIFNWLRREKEEYLLICVFHVLDEVSHELWWFMDEKHPRQSQMLRKPKP